MSKVRILKDGEAASIKYLTNAQGQQVFKSEPKPDQYLPSATELGTGFIAWLKTNFGWLYAQAQTDASLGSAYMYADGQLPSWTVLGEYDNGSASGTGRTEYIWLPTEDGGAVPVGMFRNSKFFAIHSDHLGTPRLMTDSLNKPVWQWPYSAFGNNKPTGILKPTTSATGAFTNQPNLLATQNPAAVLDLRFPGQMADVETGLFYNYFRTYRPQDGRYTQGDPIGLAGGLNRFGYANQNALSYTDPRGLVAPAIALCALNPLLCAATAATAAAATANACMQTWNAVAPRIRNWMNSDAANSGDKDSSTPTGQRGSPIDVKPGTNEPANIGGRDYTGHALDRAQGRGVPPSAVEDAIQNGRRSPGNQPGTTVHTGSNGVTVVTGDRGQVITIIPR